MRGLCADVAQLVEQRIRNAKVTSSIPVIGTSNIKDLQKCKPFLFPPWGTGGALRNNDPG